MQLTYSQKLKSEMTPDRWRRIEHKVALLLVGLVIGCVVGSYIIGAMAGGA